MMSATLRSVVVTANYTAQNGDLVLVNATAGAVIVTLPLPSLGLAGVIVKKTDASANAVTVTRSGAALIDGSASHVLTGQYQLVRVDPDGTNWQVTGGVTSSATAPGIPTIGVATAGNASATVAFSAPASNGGSPITGYTATSTPGGLTGTGATSPITVAGLTNATAYTFTVRATNAVGNSGESAASNSVTPSAAPTAPVAPTIGTAAVVSATSASIGWTAPASNGGSAITGYEVKTYDSAGTLLFTNTVGVVLTYTKTGLTTGTAVKFKVAAVNAIGIGAQSAFSNTVTPVAPGASDNFNRSNENPLGTSSGGQAYTQPDATNRFQLVSNKAVAVSAGGQPLAYLETTLADFTLTLDVDVASGGEGGACFRVVDASNYWGVNFFSGFVVLKKRVAGTNSDVNGYPVGLATGLRTLKVVCLGSSIQVYMDNVLKHSVTDAAFSTATKCGLVTGFSASDTVTTFDNLLIVP